MNRTTRHLLALVLAIPGYGLPAAAGERNRLAGTQWVLVSFVEGATALPPAEGTRSTLEFSAGEPPVVSGDAGCNSYLGAYKLEGSKLSFGRFETTKVSCRPEITEHEDRVLRALGAAGTFELAGSRLTISYDQGRRALVFARRK